MSDVNEVSDLTHNNSMISSTPKLNISHLSVSVDCEYCGLKYKTIQDKNLHQIYYCIGRDLSLDKSILKLRNNHNMNKNMNIVNNVNASNVSVKSIANSSNNRSTKTATTTTTTTASTVFDTNITGTEGLNIKGFKYPSSILKTPRVVNIKNTPDLFKTSNNDISKNSSSNIQDLTINSFSNASVQNSSRSVSFKMESNIKVYVLRLRPNQDLHKELDKFVKDNDLKAAFIITCVGSLTKATLRMAYSGQEQNEVKVINEHLEIVSLVGTLSSTGGHHLHISLSNKDGNCLGGHVFGEMNVFTTAEIVIGECASLTFDREYDNQSGFDELVVKPRII